MAIAFSGYRYGGAGPNVASVVINPNSGGSGSSGSACVVGDWMIMIMTGGAAPGDMNMVGDLSGWTIVRAFAASNGALSFQTGVWIKRRESGDTTYTWPLDGTGQGAYWTLTWYSGAEDAFGGTFWDRNGHGTSLTNVAPSVTTTMNGSMVVSISTERTIATETDSQISVNNGMTKRLFNTMPPTTGDQNVSVADKIMAVAGASGDTTWTYPNTQANNGIAGHIWLTPKIYEPSADVPVIVGTPTTAGSATNTHQLTLNVPNDVVGGLQVGDILVAALRGQSSNSPYDWTNASFTRQGPAFIPASSDGRVTGFFTHVVTNPGSEPSSYLFTTHVSYGARVAGVLCVVRGANPTPSGYYDSYIGDSISGGRSISSYPAFDPSLVLMLGANELIPTYNHTPTNPPDNFTTVAEIVTTGDVSSTSRTYLWVGARELTGSVNTVGAPDTDITWSVMNGVVAQSIAFAPTNPYALDYTAKLGDTGSILTHAYVRVGDTGSTMSKISGMRAMLPRYRTVQDMLSQDEIYWAHRGGSRDFPEMSLYAYGQAALLSYGCLELSLARTSDGVWFGLHDENLNRTSGTTGLGAASTMTWAQVQTYEILGSMAANNPTQPNRPYARLEDILDTYSHHLFVIDVKYATAYREELLNILDSYGGAERFIGKSYGVGSAGFASSFTARGYQRWGYFYGSDIPSLNTTHVNQWTLIGMDYAASQSNWDTLASYRTNGQRMMGHICPDLAAVATARGKGAAGFMVSGVRAVDPFI